MLQDTSIGEGNEGFSELWKVMALPAQHFAQRVLVYKITTKDNLMNKGIIMSSTTCVMCAVEDEIINHLFFKCKIEWYMWNQYTKWFAIVGVHHFKVDHDFKQFYLMELSKKRNNARRCLWMVMVGYNWNQRNNILF